jgi:hypothetical protein
MDDPAAIATYYQLDSSRPAVMTVGGLRAYAALDRRDPARRLIALQSRPELPPRSRTLMRLGAAPVPHALTPLDQGPGRDPAGQEGWFILCVAPPGPALSASMGTPPRPWSETEAIQALLKPAATALHALAQRGVTHRAIRPDNLFRSGPGEPVTLGPFWAAPPASLQPNVFEPPYVAMCLPAGRGEGTAADDVYALGAVLLWCVLGGPPAWSEPSGLLWRKLALGSLPALAAGSTLSTAFQELLRLMLAEDPDHRPTPELLMAPDQARSRRLATRPTPRATRPLQVGNVACSTARELAHALCVQPEAGMALIRSGAMDGWLRRVLGDGQLAVLAEKMIASAADAETDEQRRNAGILMRVAWALDPLIPLIWRGIALFPDGLGSALAAAQAAGQAVVCANLEELVMFDVITFWSALQTKRTDLDALRQETRDWRAWLVARGAMGGAKRLSYALNPLLTCGSALLAGRAVARLADLLPALELSAAVADRKRPPVDAHVAAFVAARADATLLADIGQLEGFTTLPERISVLRLFARLQSRLHPAPLPALAAWLLESRLVDLEQWRNLHTRKSVGAKLAEAASAGQIGTMLNIAQDEFALAADRAGAAAAAGRAVAIAEELAALAAGSSRRQDNAERLAYDVAAGAGLLALLLAAVTLGLGP